MIGTTRSRVSFFMNKFRKLGLISYNGKIEVHSSLLNAVLYDKPEIKREQRPGSGISPGIITRAPRFFAIPDARQAPSPGDPLRT